MSENTEQHNFEQDEEVSTKHGPHLHASRRIFIGVGAIALIVVGVVVWLMLGGDAQGACPEDVSTCTVKLP